MTVHVHPDVQKSSPRRRSRRPVKADARKRKEFKRLEIDTTESPDDVSATWATSQLDQLFGVSKSREQKAGDRALFANDKRRVRTKPICNLGISKPRSSNLGAPFAVNDGVTLTKVRDDDGPWRDTVERRSAEHLASPSELRRINELYAVEFPEDTNPDHELFRRSPRNRSPSREQDQAVLLPLSLYFDLHRSIEPLQTNWGEIDAQRPFLDDYDTFSRLTQSDPDAELEIRPSWQELEARFNNAIRYITRWVPGGPLLRAVGYVTQYRYRMIVPVSGNVHCVEHIGNAVNVIKLDDASRHLPIYRLGELEFATERHRSRKSPRLGELLKYSGRPVKDAYGTPKGPASKGSNFNFWKPLYPRGTSSCGLPYDVDSYDELQFGYCWGAKSAAPSGSQPFDDVVQRKLDRMRLRQRLSPNERLVLDMLVWTDHTDILAESYADLGAAVLGRPTSRRTQHRYGQAAIRWVCRAVANALVSVSGNSPRIRMEDRRRWSSVSVMHDWRRPAASQRFRPSRWHIFRPDTAWRLRCC